MMPFAQNEFTKYILLVVPLSSTGIHGDIMAQLPTAAFSQHFASLSGWSFKFIITIFRKSPRGILKALTSARSERISYSFHKQY